MGSRRKLLRPLKLLNMDQGKIKVHDFEDWNHEMKIACLDFLNLKKKFYSRKSSTQGDEEPGHDCTRCVLSILR